MMRTEEGRRRSTEGARLIKKYVTFVPYMKAGMTVEDVEPIIRNKCEEHAREEQRQGLRPVRLRLPGQAGDQARLGRPHGAAPHPRLRLQLPRQPRLEYRYHSLVGYQTNREGAQGAAGPAR
jgi:hypothetical protein